MPSGVRGLYFYLYLVLDLYSRKIVAWEVHGQECGELAAELIKRAVLAEGIGRNHRPLVLHADNGAPMRSATLLETLRQRPHPPRLLRRVSAQADHSRKIRQPHRAV